MMENAVRHLAALARQRFLDGDLVATLPKLGSASRADICGERDYSDLKVSVDIDAE